MVQARLHLDFCAEIYRHQLAHGRHFLHEHPVTAESWKEDFIVEIRKDPKVGSVIGDMCQFGMELMDESGHVLPVKKPTRWMSSSPAILEQLGKRCIKACGHTHIILFGKRKTTAAAEYPPALCRDILRGVQNQFKSEA